MTPRSRRKKPSKQHHYYRVNDSTSRANGRVNQCCPRPDPDGASVVVVTDRSRVGSCCCVSLVDGATDAVCAGVVTEGDVTVGATVVTVWAGAGFCVGDGATVAVGVGDAVAGLVTTGSLDGTVAEWVAVSVDGTDDGAEVVVAVDADVDADVDVDVAVELLNVVGDVELVGSVGDVVLVVSDGDVDAVDDVASDDEVVVDELDVVLEEVDVVSTTGTGSSVSGEDGRTGSGSPGGGKVAAGFCSTTL